MEVDSQLTSFRCHVAPRVDWSIKLASALLLLAASAQAEIQPDWLLRDGLDRAPATVLRINQLLLRDPHIFVQAFPGPLGCLDVTDNALLGASFNSQLQQALSSDGDGDGLLDSSPLLLFRPLARDGSLQQLQQVEGSCTAPVAGTSCSLPPGFDGPPQNYASFETGTEACLGPLSGTTGGYSPAVAAAAPPCFTTAARSGTLASGAVLLDLAAVRVAGSWAASPPATVQTGVLRGFLSESAANALILPATLPAPLGGQPLAKFLKGGQGSCASGDDRDVHEGITGWWFHFNYAAGPVPILPAP